MAPKKKKNRAEELLALTVFAERLARKLEHKRQEVDRMVGESAHLEAQIVDEELKIKNIGAA